MKKKSPRIAASRKATPNRTSRKPVAGDGSPNELAPAKTVREITEGAEVLYGKAQGVGRGGKERRGKTGGEGVEAGEIVTDDKAGKKGKPFPIVGIGASAGGYEAILE